MAFRQSLAMVLLAVDDEVDIERAVAGPQADMRGAKLRRFDEEASADPHDRRLVLGQLFNLGRGVDSRVEELLRNRVA